MTLTNVFEKLSEKQKGLSLRISDILINRALKRAHATFNEQTKKEMERIFNLPDDKEKEDFLKKNTPNLKKLIKEEAQKFEEELKAVAP